MRKKSSLLAASIVLGSMIIACGLIINGMMDRYYVFTNPEGKITGTLRIDKLTGKTEYIRYEDQGRDLIWEEVDGEEN